METKKTINDIPIEIRQKIAAQLKVISNTLMVIELTLKEHSDEALSTQLMGFPVSVWGIVNNLRKQINPEHHV